MVDIQNIRELLELMVANDLSEIKIREGETSIVLRKGGVAQPMVVSAPPPAAHPVEAGALAAPDAGEAGSPDEGLVPVPSPMVGTVYMASDPESPPLISIGQEVGNDTTVCVIEAMKVFNEIQAEVTGTIERILVHNEQAVEFGQPLFLVRPQS